MADNGFSIVINILYINEMPIFFVQLFMALEQSNIVPYMGMAVWSL